MNIIQRYSLNMDTQVLTHEKWMRRCLELAALGAGQVGAGVMVGSVLVRDNNEIARGYHISFGEKHAERDLLLSYERDIQSMDVLYVNLEPCVEHASKKTPGCSELLLKRGVKQLVYGMKDPDPRIFGRGLSYLSTHGVKVHGPILERECRELNRGFVSLRTRGRPWCASCKSYSDLYFDPARSAWSRRYDPFPFAAVLTHVDEIEKLMPAITAAGCTPKPHALPLIVVLGPDDSTSASRGLGSIISSLCRTVWVSKIDLVELAEPEGAFSGVASIVVAKESRLWESLFTQALIDEREGE